MTRAVGERPLAQVGAIEDQEIEHKQAGALGPLRRAEGIEIREPSWTGRDRFSVENHVGR